MMNTKINQDECLSSLVDGEVTDAQLDAILLSMKNGQAEQVLSQWTIYQQIGDVLRSDDLNHSVSPSFTDQFSRLLEQEPVIVAPKNRAVSHMHESSNAINLKVALKSYLPRYVAMTSIAAAVIVAFVMTPQIIPLLHYGNASSSSLVLTKNEQEELKPDVSVQLANHHSSENKVDEFAPTLMDQAEMLRDPTLDSYLMAHQKTSPAFAHSGHYVKKETIEPSKETEK